MTYPETPGYVNGSSTSQAAAHAIIAKVGKLQRLTLDLIDSNSPPGLTDERLDLLAGRTSTLRPRRCELTTLGLVVDSGLRDRNASGLPAVVWTVLWKRKRYIPRQELNGD